MTTQVYTVLAGETMIQYINIPALDEATGLTPVTPEEAEALLSALVDVINGL